MKRISIKIFAMIFALFFNEVFSQTWVRKNEGYSFWSIEKDFAGNIYAGTTGTPRGIFKSTDGGETWTNIYSTGASNYLEIACDPQNNVYVANSTNGLLISTNGGINFTNVPVSTFGGNSVNTVACGPNGLVLVGVTSGGIYRSTDYGATFTQTLSGYSIVSLEFDKFNPNRVYAGSSSTTLNGFFISTNGGLTFSGPTNSINVWEILQRQNGELFVLGTTAGYPVLKSTDLGLTWAQVGTTPNAIRGACLDLVENIYAAGNGGVYRSTNGGQTFTNMNLTSSSNKIISYQNKILAAVTGTTTGGIYIFTDQTIPVELISFEAFVNSNQITLKWKTATELNNFGFEIQRRESDGDYMTIGFVRGKGNSSEICEYSYVDKNLKSGKYFYRLKQIDYDGIISYSNEVVVEINLLTQFNLEQNYPNPFNPSTKIKFSIPENSLVKLTVYNLIGKVVKEILNQSMNAGNYEVEFDGSNLSSGIYFYRLEAGKYSNTKRMILIR
ncbi:MAG: T9SS type A sorting domain-containing protein [Ignavibacterium sp.]|nr:T9SS type A sorting domain-containing protein [Ignavibacterium sp.]